jgi:putative transposase
MVRGLIARDDGKGRKYRKGCDDVIAALAELFARRGVSQHIRSCNRPEFNARANHQWTQRRKMESFCVEPESPWKNGYTESFRNRPSNEPLSLEDFESLGPPQES